MTIRTANLQHPNLLSLFDSGEADGLLFYVMPFVEGESLRARIDREKQLPIDDAVSIATAVASALDYAHRHGVIHRDHARRWSLICWRCLRLWLGSGSTIHQGLD